MKAKATLKDKTAAAVEAPIYPDQREVKGTLLATLATVINSDVADLRYSLLELTAADFHFRDHQTTFAAMKKLADAGDHINMVTVRAEVGDAWPETLKAVFDPSKASTSAAETYKQKIIPGKLARKNSRAAASGRPKQTAFTSEGREGFSSAIPGEREGLLTINIDNIRNNAGRPAAAGLAETWMKETKVIASLELKQHRGELPDSAWQQYIQNRPARLRGGGVTLTNRVFTSKFYITSN